MTKKNHIRSIRFDDNMAELIDQQVGDTFQQKFEALVYKCVWELPARKEELERVEEQIREEKRKLARIRESRAKLQNLEWKIENAIKALEAIARDAEEIST